MSVTMISTDPVVTDVPELIVDVRVAVEPTITVDCLSTVDVAIEYEAGE